MYKLLLCWRYLTTRYLALASIISVMLGVATLIVVNSVMGGFSTKLKDRLRGIQAEVVIESRTHDGFYDYPGVMARVDQLCGDKIESMSPVIESFAMLQFKFRGEVITRPVRLVGVDPAAQSKVGRFGEHLLDANHQKDPSTAFNLPARKPRPYEDSPPARPGNSPVLDPPAPVENPVFAAVIGYGIATYRNPDAKSSDAEKDVYILKPGDEIILTTVSRSELEGHDGRKGFARPVPFRCVITDHFKCDMSEYDSNLVYIDLKDMQNLRTMQNRATSIQIKLKDYDRDAKEVVSILSQEFHPYFIVETWENKQGPLLAAIGIERGLLNVLLFLIIAVAGFGILAIFFMIVVEKTRDIGIMKALGASNRGVMGIFLSYGLALGIVGAGLGTALGIAITVWINEIEQFISQMTGQDVFPRNVYYFDKIPTDMQTLSILLVNAGAVLIAVAASVFPSLRAALLHPVQALRYE